MGGAWATPGAYVYIHKLLHRLGYRIGNHRQLPFGSIQWVTDMPPTMHDRHAVYDSRRVTDGHRQHTASMATHTVLGSLYESYRGFVS